jgi:hypothetical protein
VEVASPKAADVLRLFRPSDVRIPYAGDGRASQFLVNGLHLPIGVRASMQDVIRVIGLVAVCVMSLGETTPAQNAGQSVKDEEGWRITVYPILAWVPLDIGIDVEVPPFDGSAGESAQIIESRFDGAFFGGITASNGTWWIEGYGIWAGFGGDRIERPSLVVDLDLIYGDAKLGRRVARDVYVTGGLRRVALDYDLTLGNLPRLSGTAGVWDPMVGIGWHRIGPMVEWHASFEGGGFGVGADIDIGGTVRVDWKPIRHFGLTGGYNFVYLKVSDSVAGRTVTVEPLVHGPSVGFGLYF